MHLTDLVREEAMTFDDVVVEFIPFRCGGELGARVFGERVQGKTVGDEEKRVEDKGYEVQKEDERPHCVRE